jgi:kynurenine formamidase
MSQYIEFSHLISKETSVMEAGFKPPAVIVRSRIAEGRHSNTSYLEMFAHTGTHIDAPWHFIDQGRKIEDFSIGEFVFSNVLLVEIPAGPHEPIPAAALKSHHDLLLRTDCLLIYSGFSVYRDTDEQTYTHATPGLSVEAAEYLRGFDGLRCIGVDFISIENVQNGRETNFPVHHLLLGRQAPMILLEDANLSALRSKEIKKVFLFPLRMAGIEASPVAAVAEMKE